MRIAVFSHGHPARRAGGGEVAAYAVFERLKAAGLPASFVALVGGDDLGDERVFAPFEGRADEILWRRANIDTFNCASLDPDGLRRELGAALAYLRPDVVHFHHYFGFSADCLEMTARDFGVPTLLTLHEYGAISPHSPQLLDADGRRYRRWDEAGGPLGPAFVRRERLLAKFQSIDRFIAPSRFLADIYVEWGLDRRRLSVIENPLPLRPAAKAPKHRGGPFTSRRPLRLGFFGQVSAMKGVEVLLRALNALPGDVGSCVRLELFGAEKGLEIASGVSDRVVFRGAYDNAVVTSLMQTVDWVVAPSVWWENSPMVIQEARAAGVPVLTSDIGGMREKVRDGVDGAHFRVGSPSSLAAKLAAIVQGDLIVTPSPAPDSDITELTQLYRKAVLRSARYEPATPARSRAY